MTPKYAEGVIFVAHFIQSPLLNMSCGEHLVLLALAAIHDGENPTNRELAKRCAMRVETFIACCEKLVEAGWVVEGADGPWLNVDAMLPFVDAAVRARNIPRQQPEAVVH